ncbi:hypothetical protein EHQ16_09515 [Leptospira kanakyensis]|uniref:Lipoprotein n=1 Tax=Leptospira kanakyensis TaxID=2484968 RepID=A0A6N4Q936_9LEPT|nr:hypothetical protein [Leptospira kanakyensis]TGK49459.1 hypothetical protein EHQ11_15675 [Leptospira kanakyensis]TGK60301.1 hypothetical protein EHQ16_09515 [Leptospira kanakyensis]TGK67700.1 hypothetical protein EHQ18_14315 [Leptospira kanakyensis]
MEKIRMLKSIIFFSIFFSISCATVLTPKYSTIYIRSNEQKNGHVSCGEGEKKIYFSSPDIVKIESNKKCTIVIKIDNKEHILLIPKMYNPSLVGNYGSPGIIFFPIDFLTGYYKIPKDSIIELDNYKSYIDE